MTEEKHSKFLLVLKYALLLVMIAGLIYAFPRVEGWYDALGEQFPLFARIREWAERVTGM